MEGHDTNQVFRLKILEGFHTKSKQRNKGFCRRKHVVYVLDHFGVKPELKKISLKSWIQQELKCFADRIYMKAIMGGQLPANIISGAFERFPFLHKESAFPAAVV